MSLQIMSKLVGEGMPLSEVRGLEALVDLGARLIPLTGKRPVKKRWPESDPVCAQKALNWLHDGYNIGMVTGEVSGFVVIDIDPRNGGDCGLRGLEERLGSLPETLTCMTGGGGLHLYFRWYPGAKSAKPLAGIDFQAERRCVVVPPSVHPATECAYAWREPPDTARIAELPKVWQAAMSGQESNVNVARVTSRAPSDDGPILEGSRNAKLFESACELYASGSSESSVLSSVSEINDLRCCPPLQPSEVRRIVQSAYRYKPTKQSFLTRWLHSLMRSDLDRREKMVAVVLTLFADIRGGRCFPSQETIAELACYSRPRVSEALRKLEAAGWLKHYRISRAGKGWSNGYRLLIPDVTPENIRGADVI